ncbi:uncharacterized protein LOC115763096 isoform X1 [Drosophila novamexicana]|uniref:uncharacterized protein LOC115763096 isoform X1 n=2 Tax=Drosophila novamexicana TaxID=47314 RepID=UPI0011E5D394|nr:uncharacterized protein LOC115763096 isoform X1 [Drosophila novamexicana]
MLSLLSTVGHIFDVVLIRPITAVIETLVAVVYYFLAASWFVGYCLVEAGAHIWKVLCDGYQIATIIYKECTLFYCELRHMLGEVSDYIYYGTGDGLSLARYLAEEVILFLGNVLIGLGNCTLWILLLLPRAIICIVDYIILLLDKLVSYIVERGTHLLNNVFRLSIGIAVLLVLYMFRRYVYLLAVYLLRSLRTEVSTKVRWVLEWASNWTDRHLSWVLQKLEVAEPSGNASGSRTHCVVCLERNRNIVVLPCRHFCLCKECSQQLRRFEGGNRCPLCRHNVDTLMPVFD